MLRAVQITEKATTWAEADAILRGLAAQDDYLGGRVYASVGGWKVQAFHEAAEEGCWLPDGCRHVLIPAGLCASLGLEV